MPLFPLLFMFVKLVLFKTIFGALFKTNLFNGFEISMKLFPFFDTLFDFFLNCRSY
jgi:hypothetical protein